MERLLPLSTVARRLRVSERRVRAWCREGQLPAPVVLPDGARRWRESVLAAWVAELPIHSARVMPSTAAENSGEELRDAILRVLREANGEWMRGEDIAARIDEDLEHTSGTWRRTVGELRRAGLIETNKTCGYRLV